MLKSLKIKNFQSHKKTFLKFNKGLNVISGKSDSGKSGIIRAINWVIHNKPSGQSFRSHWGGTTSVTLKTNKSIIKRVKGKSNAYFLNGKKFVSFKKEVPQEIKEAIKISHIGLQKQMDSPFLFSLSGGEVSKFINQIVDIDIIDSSIANINRTLKNEKSDFEKSKTLLIQKREERKKYIWIKEAEQELLNLEFLEIKLNNKKVLINSTEQILNSIDENIKRNRDISCLTDSKTLNRFNRITKLYKSIEKNQAVLVNVRDLLASESILRRNLVVLNAKLRKNEQKLEKTLKICPFCGRKD